MNLVNLTPHAVNFFAPDDCPNGTVLPGAEPCRTIPPTLPPARVSCTWEPVGEIDGVPLHQPTYGQVQGLPDPAPGVAYIVSLLTAQAAAASGRTTHDLYAVAQTVRDGSGRIVGCLGLSQPV